MKYPNVAKAEIHINASAAEVWKALTDPAMVKQYLFGTDVSSDWKVGSSLTYTGVWEGKAYTDKGTILEIEPEKLLVSTYHSNFLALPDLPENHQVVSYILAPEDGGTKLTIKQENVDTPESAKHSEGNWGAVLAKMKELLEK